MNLKSTLKKASGLALMIPTLVFLLLQHVVSFAQTSTKDKINIGLVYPLSSNWKDAPNDTNSFSVNLIAGVSAAEHGIAIAGVSNVIHNNTSGLLVAGFSNHIGKKADGTMVSGFMNTYKSGNGLAIAGFGNFSKQSTGVQFSGFINVGGNVSDFQGAGFINVTKNVRGLQVSGFMNIAKNVKGVQIAGLINIADSANCQIGIINISKNGEKNLGITIDENQTLLVSFRSGGKLLYGIVGLGYNLKNSKSTYAWEAGFGIHAINAGSFYLNAEFAQTGLLDFKSGHYFKSSHTLLPAIRIANRVDLFAGPSFNYVDTNIKTDQQLQKKYISSWGGTNGNDFRGFYFGYTAGIQIRL